MARKKIVRKDTIVRLLLVSEMGQGNVMQDEPLGRYTSFRVGGPADWLIRANDSDALVRAVYVARRAKLPYRIIGGGSNILVSDAGFRGIIILNKATNYEMIEHARGFVLCADSGVMLPRLAGELAKRGASGMEWAVGIPGTIGGAIVQNAGAWGSETKERLLSAEYVMPSEDAVHTVQAAQLGLRYRGSNILDVAPDQRPILVRAWFRLDRDDPSSIATRNAMNIAERTATQPRQASGGSTFRNPEGERAAGWLLDQVGMKGFRIGNAAFSDRHANFIVNLGGATAEDIRELIKVGHHRVKLRFGIALHPEIEFVGEWDTPRGEELPEEAREE